MDGVTAEDTKLYKEPSMVNVNIAAMKLADGVIKSAEEKNATIDAYLKKATKPLLTIPSYEDESSFVSACSDFYDELLETEPVLAD